MYTKEQILQYLNADNYFIDMKALELFINAWNVDAIYEDENGEEFYDDMSISKIKRGISLKSQGFTNDQISYRISKLTKDELPAVLPTPVEQPPAEVPAETVTSPQLKNVTLNVTNETLQMIAEAVAQKIAVDIKEHINTNEIAVSLIEAGSYKRDNEILAQQINELLEDNKKMALRIDMLEKKRKSFLRRIFS